MVWLSLVERFVRDEEVAGSNPVTAIFFMGIFGGLSPDVLIFLCENRGALHETLHENEISFIKSVEINTLHGMDF